MKWVLLVFYILAIQYNRWLAKLANHKAYHDSLALPVPSTRIPLTFWNSTPLSMRLIAYSAPALVLLLAGMFYGVEEAFFWALAYPGFRCSLWLLGVWRAAIFGMRLR